MDLTGNQIKNSYGSLVTFPSTTGFASSASLLQLSDGKNNLLPLYISATLFAFTGDTIYSGATTGAFTNSKGHFQATVNSYSQVNSINLSNGTSASTDFICTADTGSDTTNYIDFGINSSGYTDATFTIGGALTGYVYTNGGDFTLGTGTAAKIIKFHTGGTLAANERVRITDAGVAIGGQAAPTSLLDVTTNAIGQTQTNTSGIALVNTTAAASSSQQYSPAIRWLGRGWKTNSTAASQTVEFRSYVIPVQGAVNPTGYLTFESTINAGTYTNMINMLSTGDIGINTISPNNFGWSRAFGIAQTTSGNNVGINLFGNRANANDLICGFNMYNGTSTAVANMYVYRGGSSTSGYMAFQTAKTGSLSNALTIDENQCVSIGTSVSPTAYLHITKAGTTTAGTAPLKFTSGTNLTIAEAGAIEYNGTNFFATRTGTTRETLLTGVLTSGAVSPDALNYVAINMNGAIVKFIIST